MPGNGSAGKLSVLVSFKKNPKSLVTAMPDVGQPLSSKKK